MSTYISTNIISKIRSGFFYCRRTLFEKTKGHLSIVLDYISCHQYITLIGLAVLFIILYLCLTCFEGPTIEGLKVEFISTAIDIILVSLFIAAAQNRTTHKEDIEELKSEIQILKLENTKLSSARIHKCIKNLNKKEEYSIDLSRAELDNFTCLRIEVKKSNWAVMSISDSSIMNSSFEETIFSKSLFKNSTIGNSKFEIDSAFDHCTFKNVTFSNVSLSTSDFTSCTFHNVIFHDCNFRDSNMTNAILIDCTISGTTSFSAEQKEMIAAITTSH